MDIKHSFSLKDYNTFGINAEAARFIEVFSEAELKVLSNTISKEEDKLLVLGGGSNILPKSNFNGTVLKISIPGIQVLKENEDYVFIKAGAGVIWDDLVEFTVKENYSGIENLSYIPGSVGAAPIQNIGAYGAEISSVFHCLEAYGIKEVKRRIFHKEDCSFGYRDSIFKKELKGKYIITSVTLKLNKLFYPNLSYSSLRDEIEKRNIREPALREMREMVIRIRTEKLPDPKKFGNAGSFFKNPEVSREFYDSLRDKFPDVKGYAIGDKFKIYAGWLIEKSGWKGTREGNVGSYPLQALVIVNYGGATGSEVIEFSEKIKKSVAMKFGIELQEEVNII